MQPLPQGQEEEARIEAPLGDTWTRKSPRGYVPYRPKGRLGDIVVGRAENRGRLFNELHDPAQTRQIALQRADQGYRRVHTSRQEPRVFLIEPLHRGHQLRSLI